MLAARRTKVHQVISERGGVTYCTCTTLYTPPRQSIARAVADPPARRRASAARRAPRRVVARPAAPLREQAHARVVCCTTNYYYSSTPREPYCRPAEHRVKRSLTVAVSHVAQLHRPEPCRARCLNQVRLASAVSSRLASSVCASTHLRVGLHQWSRADEDGSRSPSLEEREHHADAADTLCDPVKQYNLRPICQTLCLSVSLVCKKIQNE